MRRHIFITLLLATPLWVLGQHLQRRPFLGCRALAPNDSVIAAHRLPSAQGLLVERAMPEGSFAKMGGRDGDLLLSLNGQPVTTQAALPGQVAQLKTGQPLEVELSRAGKRMKLKGTVMPLPFEKAAPGTEVVYGEMPFKGGHVRTILNRPATPGPHPALLFIPGYTCATVDALPAYHPYAILIDSMVRSGFAVYRVEKPGVGDGPHPCLCAETGFDLELELFQAGYASMVAQPGIDPGRAFIFGHSMGGLQAPMIAAAAPVQPKGIAVYGTAFQTWYEYIIALVRFQYPRNGSAYPAFEDDMTASISLFYKHYVEMVPLSEIIKNPEWEALLKRDWELTDAGDLIGRKAFYWQELAAKHPAREWVKVQGKVLAMYGSADFEVFNPFNMSEIARIVNEAHPGNGRFVELSGVDHSMIQVGGMDEGLALRFSPAYRKAFMENMDPRVCAELLAWMRAVRG